MTLTIQSAEPEHAIETLEIGSICRDVQVRIKTDPRTVDDYHRALNDDPPAKFPPVVCFREKKTGALYLADGNHRLESRLKNGEATIEAEVRIGGKREALAYALGSSKGHGLRFSNADKRKAATLALKDSKLKKLSDNQISALIGVSQPFISKLRAELITVITPPSDDAAPAADPAPSSKRAAPLDLERLVGRFRKLLTEVPEDMRTDFGVKILAIFEENGTKSTAAE